MYIVTEDYAGTPLKALVDKKKGLPIRECLRIVNDMAKVLHYLHGNGIVHQGLTLDCIVMLDNSQEIRLKDMEIRRVQALLGVTPEPALNGHLYMSPEEIAGKKTDLTFAP